MVELSPDVLKKKKISRTIVSYGKPKLPIGETTEAAETINQQLVVNFLQKIVLQNVHEMTKVKKFSHINLITKKQQAVRSQQSRGYMVSFFCCLGKHD